MSIEKTGRRLSLISAKMHDSPADHMQWPAQVHPGTEWFTSPQLISIYGSPVYSVLSEAEKKRLSFYEAVNFYSLNINGEKPLVEGLNRRLYAKGYESLLPYLHHFLDEENKHMQYFGRFCLDYAGKTYPDRKLVFPKTYAPGEEDFLFFVKVVIFEEIADRHNVLQGADADLHPIARQINQMHHQDEARHLIFGREIVQELFQKFVSVWPQEVLTGIRLYLPQYLVATWKEYYNPDIYKDAGLEQPYELAKAAWNLPEQKIRRQQLSASCVQFLLDQNILLEEPLL